MNLISSKHCRHIFEELYLNVTCWVIFCLALFGLAACTVEPQTPSPEASQTITPTVVFTRTPRPKRSVTPNPTLSPSSVPSPVSPISVLGIESADLQGATLRFWHPWQNDAGAYLQRLLDEFNRTNSWEIHVEAVVYNGWGPMEETLKMAVLTDERPNIVVGYSHQLRRWVVSTGGFVDLDNYVHDPIWGYSPSQQEDFYPEVWAQDIDEPQNDHPGQIRLGLPWYRTGYVLIYNRTWAKELGFNEPPQTAHDLRAQACRAAEANLRDSDPANDGKGGWMLTTDPALLESWIMAYDGTLTAPDGNGYRLHTSQAEQALDEIQRAYREKCAWLNVVPYPQDKFAGRGALFYGASLAELDVIQQSMQQVQNLDEWDVLPFLGPDGQQVIGISGPSLAMLPAAPKEQLASWLFIQWLVSPENQARWVEYVRELPASASVPGQLDPSAEVLAQWESALQLMPYIRGEPANASWGSVRWAFSEAIEWLLLGDMEPAQVLEILDQLALEVYNQE